MANPFRRFPSFYGRDPEGQLFGFIGTLENRQLHKLEIGHNAHLISDDFWEAPAVGGGTTGTLTATLGALSVAATAGVGISGSATPMLGTITATGTAQVGVTGSAARTLGTLTASGTGNVGGTGTLAGTLGTLGVTGSGNITVTGSLSQTLGLVTCSGSGTSPGGGTTTIRRYYRGRPMSAAAVRLSKSYYYIDEAA